ncbi:MAG: helix-turn-helix transcriptional regulator [Geodermatophilaceae bacterium]|nr:helix-turn-helix transcriptional regulator [Geodermatophilaceae bacterium]
MEPGVGSDRPVEQGALDWSGQSTAECPIGLAVGLIGDRWSLLVLRELAFGVDRFDAVQEHLQVSRRTLAERLDTLVEADIVHRVPYRDPGQRTRHRYELTATGADVLPLLMAFGAWGERHRTGGRSPVRMVHANCGRGVHPGLRCSGGHDLADSSQIIPQLRVSAAPLTQRRQPPPAAG